MRWLKTVALVVAVAAVALGGRWWLTSSHEAGGTTSTGVAAIGGPFTLTDGSGAKVTHADFQGRYMLIFFGYTYCPDVCPGTLGTFGRALDLLPAATADRIVPIFITVDPERDTPAMVGEYVRHFHPRLIGLSGTPDQTRDVMRAYRVYAAKVEQREGDPGAYLMDHSAISYLMGPDGAFVSHFSHGATAESIADALSKKVR